MPTETTNTLPLTRLEPPSRMRGTPMTLSWGAIFGGAVAALAVWIMLYALGLALGLSAVDPAQPDSMRVSGIFTGIWGLVSPLLALFIGGAVASHGAGPATKTDGALHGLVMWGLTTLVGAWLLVTMLSTLVGGVASIGKSAAQAGAGVIAGAGRGAANVGDVAKTFGLDANDALRPLNERLRAEGKPEVTAQQLQAAAQDVVQQSVREGRFDRELLTSNLAENTKLTRQDAEEVATRVEAQFHAASAQVGQVASDAAKSIETGALKVADASGRAFWGIFGALFLGLVAAVLGATSGVSRRQRRWAQGGEPRLGTAAPYREVHP